MFRFEDAAQLSIGAIEMVLARVASRLSPVEAVSLMRLRTGPFYPIGP
ncbi:hypothetical protein ACFLY4_07215 [Chloroflexota bacterium]